MSEYKDYGAISRVYDKFNREEIDYSAWADFIERCFERFLSAKPELVLDLACGTGTMTRELAHRGYDMIGVDGSADMLSEAYSNSNGESILYLNQDMRSFELYGTVGAVTCCLDSLNYLVGDGDLDVTFATVHNYLDPDGVFIFDMNTPYKFENVYSDNAYILEDEGVYCGWQNFYDKKAKICDFYLSLFEEQGNGAYIRSDEHQRERCYDMVEIENSLKQNGFELCGVFSDYEFTDIKSNDHRWFFVAKAKK
jgi:SAM-dependent methyltransferase